MSDQELIILIGKSVLEHWEYITSAMFALLGGGFSLSWFILSLMHKKEIRILELELSHQRERFSQFETIMDKKISMLQSEAESLQSKLFPGKSKEEKPKVPIASYEDGLDAPTFLRRKEGQSIEVAESEATYGYRNKVLSLIEKTDIVSNIIKAIGVLY